MKNIKKLSFLLFLVMISIQYCSKDNKKQHSKNNDESYEYSVSGDIENQKIMQNINSDSLFSLIDDTIIEMKSDISNIELRKKLVSICCNPSNNTIYTTGTGKPLLNARTSTIAKNYAQKAAIIDAYRWAAYVKEWNTNPTISEIDSTVLRTIDGNIISKMILPDNTVQILVQTALK